MGKSPTKPRVADRSLPSPSEVEHALAAIQRFYEKGCKSLTDDPDHVPRSKDKGVSPRVHTAKEYRHKARAFAG